MSFQPTRDRYVRLDGTVTVAKSATGFRITVRSTGNGSIVEHTVTRPYSSEFPRSCRLNEWYDAKTRIGERIAGQYGIDPTIGSKTS
jgi:hypothetical protein